MMLAGLPTATVKAGMSLVTILPAPITECFPIVIPAVMTEFAPIHTLSEIII